MSTSAVVVTLVCLACTGFGLWLACWQDHRYERRTRLDWARTMPFDRLGDEQAVQVAEQIVYRAWVKSGQRWS